MAVTENLARYTKDKAVNLSAMSRAIGISYTCLYASLGEKGRNRPLQPLFSPSFFISKNIFALYSLFQRLSTENSKYISLFQRPLLTTLIFFAIVNKNGRGTDEEYR